MQDLINAFTTYAGPDVDAQRKQYQRMLDLTRRATNVCTGLEDIHIVKRQQFLELHLAELKALAFSSNRNGIKTKYGCFENAIKRCRNNPCLTAQCREKVLEAETALLEAIHKLETETWLERVGYVVLLSIGIPLVGYTFVFFLLVFGYQGQPDWLNRIIDALPAVLTDPLRLIPALVLPIILLLVMLLLIRRMLYDIRQWQYRRKARRTNSGSSKQEIQPSVDGDYSS